jgi:hypothetical protein
LLFAMPDVEPSLLAKSLFKAAKGTVLLWQVV